ncbi:hypothetical protein LZ30DRAFT_822519 [Colletotrichum cereale]|nr:hypothetical protein LZ30DRAFT_822519 [Colletotrichum cereale]
MLPVRNTVLRPSTLRRADDYVGQLYTPDDGLLFRACYAGVFRAQPTLAPHNTSRSLPQVKDGWAYDAALGAEGFVLLDDAVWPGDLGHPAPQLVRDRPGHPGTPGHRPTLRVRRRGPRP